MTSSYQTPQTEFCTMEYNMLTAASPTGEDFTDPEEYGGF